MKTKTVTLRLNEKQTYLATRLRRALAESAILKAGLKTNKSVTDELKEGLGVFQKWYVDGRDAVLLNDEEGTPVLTISKARKIAFLTEKGLTSFLKEALIDEVSPDLVESVVLAMKEVGMLEALSFSSSKLPKPVKAAFDQHAEAGEGARTWKAL